jgi:hypothetical protein
MRLSNFLLWQLAYAEIYVTPTLWPEFRGVHLLEGIEEYQKRDRRYGGLNGDGSSLEQSSSGKSITEALAKPKAQSKVQRFLKAARS